MPAANMRHWPALTFGALAIASAAATVLTSAGSRRWLRETDRQELRLLAAPTVTGVPRHVDFMDLEALPPPVARYLRLALRNGQRAVRIARFREDGRLRTTPDSARWMRFQARQVVAPRSMGFLWDARVRLAPALHLRVRDSYVDGTGVGLASLQSLVSIGQDRGSDALNTGELYRFLAEAVWYPTALMPSAALTWTAIDDARALATLTRGPLEVSVEFRFNRRDEVTGIYAASRPRLDAGTYRMSPWEGHFARYISVDGMRVPAEGEVGWYTAGEWRSVWEGTVTDLHYEFTGPE